MTMTFHPEADLQGSIARLFVHPVKSCAGTEVREALLTEAGLESDRAWMVVDAQGVFLTQRTLPRMALVRPEVVGDALVLRAPGMPELRLDANAAPAPATVTVWNDTVPAWDAGEAAARWFSTFLGQPCRLVRCDPAHRRLSRRDWTGGLEAPNRFSDGFPVLVASEASLDDLNHRLQAAGDQRDDQQAEAEAQDVAVRQQRRHQEMAPPHDHAVQEDDRHRLLQHREGERAEEQHRPQEDPSEDDAVFQERRKFLDDRAGLAGHQPFQVDRQRLEQLALVDHVRQRDHAEDQQRHHRQQCVVGDGARQQQALVRGKPFEHPHHELARMGQHMGRGIGKHGHAGVCFGAERCAPDELCSALQPPGFP